MRNGNTKVIIPVALVVGCLPWLILTAIVMAAIVAGMGNLPSRLSGEPKIALIHVSGVITGGTGGGGLFEATGAGVERIVEQLERARKDKAVKAIVLRINSPGGSAAASQEVYDEILRVRKSGKVVVSSMADIAASGGYYIAAASDKIYANGSTLTGSIGVIFETSDMSELFEKIGIDFEVVKSGKHKDMGSTTRKLTPEERQIMQAMIDDVFQQFVTAVSQGRKMPEAEVRELADGRIFTGRQAEKLGLVDAVGGLRMATLGAWREAGLKGEPNVVEYGRGSVIGDIFGASDSRSQPLGSGRKEEFIIRRLLQMGPELVQR